jgi:hypothetical protein
MNQVIVIKIQSPPIVRKYPGVPRDSMVAVPMNTYQDKNPNGCYVLKLVKKDMPLDVHIDKKNNVNKSHTISQNVRKYEDTSRVSP